ncbi:MAG: glycosyltransferase family 4 protein [Candidatus Lutacidiplasmatales archaeon]
MGSSGAGRGRVAIVSHGFFPTVGGSERYHLFTARALADAFDVEVFTSDRNLPPATPASSERVAVGPVGVHYLPSRNRGAERFIRPTALWRALRKFGPDVVWGNHPSPTADVAGLFALATRRPWVATYHADVSTGRWSHRRYLGWEMWLLRRARCVLVTSTRYRDILVRRGIPENRIVVVPPGPYIGDGVLPTVASPGAGARPEAPFLFVGALDAAHAYKRLDLLLQTLASLAQDGTTPVLEVVGDGDRRAEMERLAGTLGISDRVRFLGRLSDAEVAERFASARALIVPSPDSTEGFGSVAVEAMHYGCPVVVSSNVAVGDLLTGYGAAAVFDPARPGSLRDTLRRLVTDAAWRASLAEGTHAAAASLQWPPLLAAMTAPVRALARSRRSTGPAR